MKDALCRFIVWRLLPRRVIYWAAIRVAANATTGSWSDQVVPDLTAMDAVARWDEKAVEEKD